MRQVRHLLDCVEGGWAPALGVYSPSQDGIGVSGSGAMGVMGISERATAGVGGFANESGIGVYGTSTPQMALFVGKTPDMGVPGYSKSGKGVVGIAGGGGQAGYFSGTVVVVGSLQVTGNKSAVVPHPDGSHRQLYCVESPESWFEDFGEARLKDGRAHIELDPDFAALVATSSYQVFVTGPIRAMPGDEARLIAGRPLTNAGYRHRVLTPGWLRPPRVTASRRLVRASST